MDWNLIGLWLSGVLTGISATMFLVVWFLHRASGCSKHAR